MSKDQSLMPEFSRVLTTEKIAPSGQFEIITASPHECKALADRFGLLDIQSLSAKLTVQPTPHRIGFNVTGSLLANVIQQCVVSLEPLSAKLESTLEAQFLPPPEEPPKGQTFDLTPDDEDYEVIIDGKIDLGELVAQRLYLALDPYPRKPGLGPIQSEFGHDNLEENPFRQLVDWPKKPS
jgi:uncharacterized metal-binding protein YceD (DUF177 family)